jgi:protein-tyrosine-phosphatase/DNA-binding transcriptional ArsR family regulator
MYRGRVIEQPQPPAFLQLVAHPLRWRLLAELAHSDRRVRELVRMTREPQNLVSYHLGRLRSGGLVTARQSSADGRDAYYTADLDRCAELLDSVGAALHPGVNRIRSRPEPRSPDRVRVLFLCTGNSSRSQMAEALSRATGEIDAFSAGSHPKPVHPDAVRVMGERGLDISAHRSKSLEIYRGEHFDYVVTLCDRVREVCPEFPGHPDTIHWSMPDPSGSTTDGAFDRAAIEIERRVGYLLTRIRHT